MKIDFVSSTIVNKPMTSIDEDEIANRILSGMVDEDKEYIRNIGYNNLITLHHTLGQYIRNNEKLWVYTWEKELDENMVDYSPYHPDAVSSRIIEKIYTLLVK